MKIAAVKQKDIKITIKDDTIVFKGAIDHEKPELFLTPLFDKVMNQMKDEIILDLTSLDFLNSSGIKPIINFLLSRDRSSVVRIKSDPASTWQKKSLTILLGLDDNIIIE